jgi:cytosine/adenosine deaminase-related metal-dependent hydrolase
MRKFSADWLVPVSQPPIPRGVVVMDDGGKILHVGRRDDFDLSELEIYQGALCPGFINAHCHLELSACKGEIAEGTGLVGFLTEFMRKRKQPGQALSEAINDADDEMWSNGIVAVGDISNTADSFARKTKSRIRYHTFVECFGLKAELAKKYFSDSLKIFSAARAQGLPASITPHAPYSVTDELFSEIFSFRENHPPVFSFHNQESEEENRWARGEASAFDQFYDHLALPPVRRHGASSFTAHLSLFPKDSNILFVHNTFINESDFEAIAQNGFNSEKLFWCFCPGANRYIENQLPPVQIFSKFPGQVCLGTDSLASNLQLSILEEMKTISESHREISLETLIQWATLNGARFLGADQELGTLEPQKSPGLNLLDPLDQFRLTAATTVRRLH